MRGKGRLSALLALLICVAGVVVTITYFTLRGSIQTRSGSVEVRGLGAPVVIRFDDWAIPTLEGESAHDVILAQGFVHASERLWQLELYQRIGQGRLAEIFGEAAVDADRLVRTLDLWGIAARELDALDPEVRSLLEAYATGVNERLRTWRGMWPPEFVVLGIEPQPWSPVASLAIGRIMSLDLSGWGTELARIAALARLPARLGADLAPGYPRWGPTIVQDSAAAPFPPDSPSTAVAGALAARAGTGSPNGPARAASDREPPARWDPLAFLASFGLHGSNAWAVGGSRTADGHPMLANDMHLSLRAPSTWYVNALRSDDGWAVAGFSTPGAPGVIVGFNEHLAWGFTNAMLDDADFVVESLNLDQSMYRDIEDWRPFETREEVIPVRGRDPVSHTVRETVRGPILTDVVPAGGLTLSLLWTGSGRRGAAAAILHLNRARGARELERALDAFETPHQNVIYATAAGEIGYRLSGSVPRRGSVDGALPISFEALPRGWEGWWPPDSVGAAVSAPASDYLASANNLQSWRAFGRVGVDYPMPFRARRIADRLEAARGWTVEDMHDLQLDTHSLMAEWLRPRAIAAARRIGADSTAEVLADWDLRVTVDALAPPIFYVWLYRLRELIAADEYDGDGWFPDVSLFRAMARAEGAWVDDVRTPEAERTASLEDEAMRTAISRARGRRWGQVHRERSTHPLGSVLWLDLLLGLHVGPYPAPGGRHTVRPDDYRRRAAVDSTSWSLPSMNEYGPSERFVAHLAPGAVTGYVLLPTGQSGNPFDPHYRDMADAWASGPLIPVGLDPAGARDRETSRLRLQPLRAAEDARRDAPPAAARTPARPLGFVDAHRAGR